MVHRISALVLSLLLLAASLCAQPGHQLNTNRNWIFGDHAGLGSAVSGPSVFAANMLATEGTASISDNSGQLLMYSKLDTIWDRNGAIMPNGGGLLPSVPLTNSGTGSECDAQSLIVPFLKDSRKYYVFSLTSYGTSTLAPSPGNDPKAGRLYYSVVDMGLNGGLGDVVPGQKGIQIDSMLCDRLVAVKGGACNIWILAMRNDGSAIHAFEITTAGINPNPVVSLCSTMSGTLDITPLFRMNSGCMRISPDNRTLAVSLSGVAFELVLTPPVALNFYGGSFQLYDFDPVTGVVSDQRTILPPPSTLLSLDQQVYNVCFSPDNTKLYLTHGVLVGLGLTQYDISSGVPATIAASAVELNSTTIGWGSGLRLGADDKVYVSGTDMSLLGAIPATTLHRIEQPNLAGTAANLLLNTVNLAPGSFARFGLGNPTVGLPPVDTTFHTNNITVCAPESTADLTVPADPSYTYLWNDGSAGSTRTVQAPGTYWVVYGPICPKIVDTFHVDAVDVRFSLGRDTLFCSSDFAYTLKPGVAGNYLWQDGSTGTDYTVTREGQYSVSVSKAGCTAADTINVTVIDLKQDLGNDTVVCKKQPFAIRLDAYVPDGASAKWSTGSTDPSIVVTATGTYSVHVSKMGCEGQDDYVVSDEMCDCITGMPNAFSPNGDGLNDVFAPVIEPGCSVAGYQLSVFNRWGELVFTTTAPGAGWNGIIKGQPADVGSYRYTISFEKGTRHNSYSIRGDVTLVR